MTAASVAPYQRHTSQDWPGRRLEKVRQEWNWARHVHETRVDDGQCPAQRLEDCLLARPQERLDTWPECGLDPLKVFPLALRKGNGPEPVEACCGTALQVHADSQHLFIGCCGQKAPVLCPAQAPQYYAPGRPRLVPGRPMHVVVPGALPADVVSPQYPGVHSGSRCGMEPQRYASGQEPVPLQLGTERRRPLTFAVVQRTGLPKVHAGQLHGGKEDPASIWHGMPFDAPSGRGAARLISHWNQQPILLWHAAPQPSPRCQPDPASPDPVSSKP